MWPKATPEVKHLGYPVLVIDSHCHLADAKFPDDVDAVIARAHAAGVSTMITIADDLIESEKCLQLAQNNEQIFCTVGVHPHNATQWNDASDDRLKELAVSSEKVKAIGEIGLDFHYDFSPRDVQKTVFHKQLIIAADVKLPVVVHCREAVEDVWSVVDELRPEKLVIHCCTETWPDVRRFTERGYLLSFTGIATYANAAEIRETIRQCPIEQMMIETDAPYLAPVPHRGKRNEPAFVAEVATLIAKEKGMTFEDVDRITTENTVRFFAL